jgi:hypothetical protein
VWLDPQESTRQGLQESASDRQISARIKRQYAARNWRAPNGMSAISQIGYDCEYCESAVPEGDVGCRDIVDFHPHNGVRYNGL